MCISDVKSSLFKYCRATNFSSALVAASPVGPGVVLEPLGALEVAAVVVPAGGVAPGPPGVVAPLAGPVCVPVLVAEGQAVVALAPPVVLVLVVEALVLVIGALVLEVAVEPVVVVVEGLTVVAAASTVLLLPAKKSAKEPANQMLKLSLKSLILIFILIEGLVISLQKSRTLKQSKTLVNRVFGQKFKRNANLLFCFQL